MSGISDYASRPFEMLYYSGYSIKKKFARLMQKKLPVKVISIGNITVGGTGKTPATIALAEEAKKRGFSPIILTRGYGGKAGGVCIVQDAGFKIKIEKNSGEKFIFSRSPREAGDEPVVMAERLKDVPVIKCADRYSGGAFALRSLQHDMHKPFIFILDDGFQHWRLFRDIDVVLVDGLNPFGNGKMLPMGPLREPLHELKRADVFIITKARNESLLTELNDINPDAPVYFSEYKMLGARDLAGNEFPVALLKNKILYAFCGIANPESFRQAVSSSSAQMGGFKAYRDHHRYTKTNIRNLKKQSEKMNCDFLITTEKDMVKLRGLEAPENILCLEIAFDVNSAFYDDVFKRLSK